MQHDLEYDRTVPLAQLTARLRRTNGPCPMSYLDAGHPEAAPKSLVPVAHRRVSKDRGGTDHETSRNLLVRNQIHAQLVGQFHTEAIVVGDASSTEVKSDILGSRPPI